jgi:enterobacteria phage integrase
MGSKSVKGGGMAPRRRSPKNTGFPPNVKVDRKYDKETGRQTAVYYYYLMPDGKPEPLPSNEAEAKATATALNQFFAGRESGDLLTRVMQKHSSRQGLLNQLIDEFEKHFLPQKKYSASTLKEKLYKLKEYRRVWGLREVSAVNTRELALFINEKPTSSYIKHRDLLRDLFGFSCHQGYRNDNPAAVLMEKTGEDVRRKPHTQEGYDAIYNIAPDWMQRAMEIAVTSLQRRADLTRLHKRQLNIDAGTITIEQGKTEKYKTPVFIEIEMGERLRKAVNACLQSGMLCPYLLHRKPERISKKKHHPFALSDSFLTHEFAHYRDLSGAYNNLPPAERPSWHSLRGFGIHLYQEAGYPNEYIMALSGHATEGMLEYYADGHKQKKPILVKAGLK